MEGNNLTILINCTDGVNTGDGLILRENGVPLAGASTPPTEVIGVIRIYNLPVDRAKNGNTYNCESLLTAMVSQVIILTVTCKWYDYV